MEYSPLRKHSESFWESRETLCGLRPRMSITVCLHLPWRISSACTKGYLNKGIQLPLPFCILYIKWSIAPLGHMKIHVYMSELFFPWFDSRMLEGFTYCQFSRSSWHWEMNNSCTLYHTVKSDILHTDIVYTASCHMVLFIKNFCLTFLCSLCLVFKL